MVDMTGIAGYNNLSPSDFAFQAVAPAPAASIPGAAAPPGATPGTPGLLGSAWNFMFGTNGTPAPTPGPPGSDKNGLGAGLGMNIGTGQLALGGLNTLGSLWTAWNANKLAQQQFDFQKQFSTTNLNNQVTSYNTALADRANTRAFTEGKSPDSAASYIAANKMTTG